jgi:hypothetical protein
MKESREMASNRIDIGTDEWNITFVKGSVEYSIDSLVYTSLIMDKVKEGEEPARDVVVECMKEALSSSEGLTDHEIWAMSVRLAKHMGKAGNA